MISSLYLIVLLIAAVFGLSVTPAAFAAGPDLKGYQWKNRPLLVFAPAATTPAYQRIEAEIRANTDQVVDRDMVIIAVFETGQVSVDQSPASGWDTKALRRQFAAPPGKVSAMLIGKDGGLKLKQIGRFDLKEIFALIDSMPMRQQEMRNKSK